MTSPSLPVPVSAGSAPSLPAPPQHPSAIVARAVADGVELAYAAESGLPVAAQVGVLGAASLGLGGGGLYVLALMRQWLVSGSELGAALLAVASGLTLVATGATVLRTIKTLRSHAVVRLALRRDGIVLIGADETGGTERVPRSLARGATVVRGDGDFSEVRVPDGGGKMLLLAPALSAPDAQWLAETLRRYGNTD